MKYLASLPMYDFPEIRDATDEYWQLLAKNIGEIAPISLTRGIDYHDLWRDAQTIFSQSCGYPVSRMLKDYIIVLGTPSYNFAPFIPNLPSQPAKGQYCSVLISQKGKKLPQNPLFVLNGLDSQSGSQVLKHYYNVNWDNEQYILSGSHRQSIKFIAQGQGDVAAIDCVSFAILSQFESAIKEIAIIGYTPYTWGLPYIIAQKIANQHMEYMPLMQLAIKKTINNIPHHLQKILLLDDFIMTNSSHYQNF